MTEQNILMNPNPLVRFLKKPSEQFTKADIISYIESNNIQMLNFRYTGGDGRLKALSFVINSREHLEEILTTGERVDGSSLFKHIEAGSSDLYVIPRFKTAFHNPFAEIPTLDILCAYFDKDGNPLDCSPEYILKKAHDELKEKTGYCFQTMGELEYYIISEDEGLFPAEDQKAYHESTPFSKWSHFRKEAMRYIAQSGGKIKYGHSEVGNFMHEGIIYEQNEIEFLPVDVEDAADQLMIAKWILRNLAYQYEVNITFAPKITIGKAGSGMHVHTRLMKDGKNAMVENGVLSDVAKRAIAGYLDLAPSLSAFGNTNPTSYFRLVPHQEAPTNICWGDRNRSVLVRVPLGWTGKTNMLHIANPLESAEMPEFTSKQTVEFRCPDGSADIYLLMAGLTVAARHGLEMKDALDYAAKTYVDVNIFEEEHKDRVKDLAQLPVSCWESADELLRQKDIYKQYGVFTDSIIDGTARKLKSYKDQNIREELKDKPKKVMALVEKYYHCG